MKVIIEGEERNVRAREFKKALKKFKGKDISSWWRWYLKDYGFPIKYQIHHVGRDIVVKCCQNGRCWEIELTTKEFVENIDYYEAPENIRKQIEGGER